VGGFVKVGRASDFREGRGRAVKVDGVAVAVFRVGDRLFALKDACPHMGASLADGKPEGMQLECHWHHWRFDLETGRCQEREWAAADRYEVRVDGGEVWLKAPAKDEPQTPADDDADAEWIFWDAERFFKKKPDDGDTDT
jgi:nitrite reductase (NADH) small subunit/3-phenylpropionate/trans-cinnamate dioxygenase ferredoxin subunit